jgi:hypothetical protein
MQTLTHCKNLYAKSKASILNKRGAGLAFPLRYGSDAGRVRPIGLARQELIRVDSVSLTACIIAACRMGGSVSAGRNFLRIGNY